MTSDCRLTRHISSKRYKLLEIDATPETVKIKHEGRLIHIIKPYISTSMTIYGNFIGYMFLPSPSRKGERVAYALSVDCDNDNPRAFLSIALYRNIDTSDRDRARISAEVPDSNIVALRWQHWLDVRTDDDLLCRFIYYIELEISPFGIPVAVNSWTSYGEYAATTRCAQALIAGLEEMPDLVDNIDVHVFPKVFTYQGRKYAVCVETYNYSSQFREVYRWDVTDLLSRHAATRQPESILSMANHKHMPKNELVMLYSESSGCVLTTSGRFLEIDAIYYMMITNMCHRWKTTYGELVRLLKIGYNVNLPTLDNQRITCTIHDQRMHVCGIDADVVIATNRSTFNAAINSELFQLIPKDIVDYMRPYIETYVWSCSHHPQNCYTCDRIMKDTSVKECAAFELQHGWVTQNEYVTQDKYVNTILPGAENIVRLAAVWSLSDMEPPITNILINYEQRLG